MTSSGCRQNFSAEAEALINKQINLEFHASYVYLSMASWFSRDYYFFFTTCCFASSIQGRCILRKGRRQMDILKLSHQNRLKPPNLKGETIFLEAIFLGRVVLTSHKIVKNLLRTYEKLHCKRGPYRFSGKRDPSVQTDRHRSVYFIIRIRKV